MDIEVDPVVGKLACGGTIAIMECVGKQQDKFIFFHIKI